MNRIAPYFRFGGRANRQRYWLTALAVVLLYVLVLLTAFLPGALAIVALAPLVAAFWLGLAVAVRRLHDRNKSAWWLILMYGPVVVLSGLGGLMSASASADAAEAGNALSAMSLPFSIWAFIELGCLRGTEGPNRFGPDPLDPSPAEEVFA